MTVINIRGQYPYQANNNFYKNKDEYFFVYPGLVRGLFIFSR